MKLHHFFMFCCFSGRFCKMLYLICESCILNLLLICMWTGGKLQPSNGPSDIANTFLQVSMYCYAALFS